MRLVEVFVDWKPTVKGHGQNGRYVQRFEVVRRSDAKRISREDLEEYVERLRERYPDEDFKLGRVVFEGREYYVVSKKSYRRVDGRVRWAKGRIPIYFDLEEQRVFVPISYVRKRRRLASYIVFRTLGALGVSRVRYLKTEDRR